MAASAAALIGALSAPACAQSSVTTAFTYQGRMLAGGNPANGVYDLRFRLHDALNAGTPQGAALCVDNVSLIDGRFTVSLDFGSQFNGQRRYMEIEVRQDSGLDCSSPGGFTLLAPRQELAGVPYALFAMNANGAGVTNLNAGNITSGALAVAHLPSGGNWSLSSPLNFDANTLAVDASNNRVGIGTAAPAQPLHVLNDALVTALFETSHPTAAVVEFRNTSSNAMWEFSVTGPSPPFGEPVGSMYLHKTGNGFPGLIITPDNKIGIGTPVPGRPLHIVNPNAFAARFQSSSPTASVIEFTSTSSNSTWEYGVAGSVPPFPGQLVPFAVLPGSMYLYKQGQARPGLAIDPGGTVRVHSVNAVSLHAGTLNWTDAVGASGRGNSHGVFGATPSTGDIFYGVYGVASGAAHAVFADGKLTANGTKAFRIDHPADPQNKYLSHYCAESPDVINFYSGTVVLDSQGEAEVRLPSYFAAINRDPRYGLTAVGVPMPMLHVSREIDPKALEAGVDIEPGEAIPACAFRIAGGVAGAKVSWEVKAVRNDRYVRQNGAPVEQDKPESDRGTYQRPELYGESSDLLPASHPNHPNHPLAKVTPEVDR